MTTKKPSILFYVERNIHIPFLEPIHDYINKHYDVNLAFSAPPLRIPKAGIVGHGLTKTEKDRLKQKNSFYNRPEDFKADLAVVADACFYPVKHCSRVVNVGHGMISKGWFYTDSPAVRRENMADLICVPGSWHKEILAKNVFCSICDTGFIKADSMYECSRQPSNEFYRKYAIDPGRKIILFAPTFNEDLSGIPYIRERITEVSSDKILVLIKLHGMTDMKWVKMYKDIAEAENNVRLIEDCDFAAAMTCADVMISDVSSAYAEFMLLDKPVILFNSPEQKKYTQYNPNDIEYQIRDAGIQVGSVEELKLAVKLSLIDPSEYSLKRKFYAGKINSEFDGKSAQRASIAIMNLLNQSPENSSEDIFYSIIVNWDHIPAKMELDFTINEIRRKSPGLKYEIIITGPKPNWLNYLPYGVKTWITNSFTNSCSFSEAANEAEGEFIVLLKPGTVLPVLWLKWMQHYFKWYPDTGAVRAFSSRDNYKQILSTLPQPQQPASLHETSEFMLHALMGNEVPAEGIINDDECVMISDRAFNVVRNMTVKSAGVDSIQKYGVELKNSGFNLWNAVEVFVYPLEISEESINISGLLNEAIKYRKEGQYKKAIELLEKAKNSACECVSANHLKRNQELTTKLEESRAFKKRQEYRKSIELLNKLKEAIG